MDHRWRSRHHRFDYLDTPSRPLMIAFVHASLGYDWAHLRHFTAYAFNPNNWITNGSEQIIAIGVGAIISYLVWPKVHATVDGWVKGHLQAHHDALKATLAEHHETMKRHVAEEIGKLSK